MVWAVYEMPCVDPRFPRASPLDGRDSLFVLLENHLKNGLESPLIFVLF